MKRTLAVFVKSPEPGAVKTRLAADLGPETSAAVYRALAEAEIAGTRPLAREYERLFFFAPADAAAAIAAWLPGQTLLPQEGADLGLRMSAAFEEAFARGADQVAVVGTDAPWVGREHVLQAFQTLEGVDVVLGPCDDGGYYLMALSRPQPALFAEVAWSTPAVCATTLQRARDLGLRASRLGTLPDIDTLADIRRAWPQLRPLLPAHLAGVIESRLR